MALNLIKAESALRRMIKGKGAERCSSREYKKQRNRKLRRILNFDFDKSPKSELKKYRDYEY
jgi:hypothetical protein